MSTLKTTNLQHASAASPAIVLAADGTATAQLSSVNDGAIAGTRNRIINGDMRIDQRNAGASVTPTSNNTYTLDRWAAELSHSSKFSVQQNAGSVTPPATFTNYAGITSLSAFSPAASDYFMFKQSVEGFNTADLAWGTASAQSITISFWVRSSLTGTFGGAIENAASNRCYVFSFSISAANTWEKKTINIAGDTSGTWNTGNSDGIQLRFDLGSGTNWKGAAGSWGATRYFGVTGGTNLVATNGATFYITGVQLEAGSVATPFERRSFGQELVLCQRYFQKETNRPIGKAIVSNQSSAIQLPVTMRASASVTGATFSSSNGGTVGTCTIEEISTGSFAYVNSSANGSINYNYYISYSASSEL